jgi:hypothetical protein
VIHAALAFDPPLLPSPELPVEGLVVSDDVLLAASVFVVPPSAESVFAGDFVSLAVEGDSLAGGFFEP